MVLAFSFQEEKEKEEMAELVFLEITLSLGLRQDVYILPRTIFLQSQQIQC